MKDTDFHEWAITAEQFLEKQEHEDTPIRNLEEAADELLRNAGFNPKKM